MKNSYVVAIGIISVITAYYLYNQPDSNTHPSISAEQKQIINIGNKCLDFGDRAVAKDIPIIEFQKLERISKRANVIATCMQDNGYKVNPAWLKYAEPIARTDAKKTNISFDEAMTNLARHDMQVFETKAQQPSYWKK